MGDIKQNLIPNEPDLKDLVNLVKKDILLTVNCHHIGTIQSFNPLTQTASATINYKKTFFKPNPVTKVYEPVLQDYPLLLDCPVIVMGGGSGALTFPIAQGDECLVLFNDRDMDNWLHSGNTGAAAPTPRLHSFSDGIIMVGVRSLANSLASYNATATELRSKDGLNKITLEDSDGDITVTLSDALTVTFRAAGGVTIVNAIGNFTFEDNADVTFDTGTVQGIFGNGGKVSFTNATGELIAALETILTTASAGGFPLVVDPAALLVIQSFKA